MSLLSTVVYSASSADAVVNEIVPKIVGNIVIPLVELLFAVATFVFIWGLFGFFRGGDDAEARKTSRDHILWGVVGLFIMVSVYGIIRFVAATVGQSSALPF
jgi:hypothetical protein